MLKALLFPFSFLLLISPLYSQTISHPNFGLKSHPTLEIDSVVIAENSTTVFMVIENRIPDGTFCADKNISIILPSGKQLKINSADGIPRCPDTHIFKYFGEKLYFSLVFPALPAGTECIDLIEECDESCFSFTDIILDPGLNQKIDHAYSLTEKKKLKESGTVFEEILSDLSGKNCSYEGAVYWNLIHIAKEMGDDKTADEWLEKLRLSSNPHKVQYIERLEP